MITAEIPVQARDVGAELGRRAFVQQIMGLPISIHVRTIDPTREDIGAAASRAFAHLRRIDSVFSTWRADSDLLRLQHGELEIGEAHPWLAEVVDLCLEAEVRTGGLFQAWRSTEDARVVFDPTGLVKGWAVAGACAHLETVPDIAWCVGAGGDLLAGTGRGMRDVAPVWRIGIEDPTDRSRIADVVTLTRGACATSGAAARGGHVVDPRTGVRITRPGSSTVTGPDLMWADVWATAAWVDPTEAAARMAERDPAYRLIAL